ncbi:MAG: response regulator [Desulfobulbus sp.]|nr:response regulator [Desulfobulbus sp.]
MIPCKKKSILLVDDETTILAALSRDLLDEQLNFNVDTVNSGEEAINRINASNYDLIITDLIMPGLDGFQVLKAAKRKDPMTMVIILTGYGDLRSTIDALRLNADDFLEKPCDTDELLFRISNCFTKQNLHRKVQLYETILPVCSYCHKIRVDNTESANNGTWYSFEEYLHKIRRVNISHGCCPDCYLRVKQEILKDLNQHK